MNISKERVKNHCMTFLFPIGMYAVFALISLLVGNQFFFTSYTLNGIFQDSVLTTVVALAIAIPLSGGRWDFGPGAIALLGAIIGCNIGMSLHLNVFGILLLCIVSCMVLAFVEGVLYVVLKVPNMIISLGIVMLYESLSGMLNNGLGANIFANDADYTTHILSVSKAPLCYILLLLVMIIVHFLLYKTKFGYDTRSLGAHAKLAVNSGVHEKKNILLTYLLVGFLLGIAAMLNACGGKIEPASNLSSTALMFSSMAPVLIGLFLAEYSNMPWGIFMGAVGMEVFSYGMNSFGVDGSLQTIVTGIVLAFIMAYINDKDKVKNFILNLFMRKELGKHEI
ncbi:ABC transporter permease [Kineothrix sedimenti]|uniref:Monosaccharide ABC transporter membrane protein (CUT2 family) n=1 Tax=Kineothrix sedimenti TaxID=3123317 RepID=A0ABZ3ERQ5_9FIRM